MPDCSACSTINQIVGTPSDSVMLSLSIRSSRSSPPMWGPGKTCFAPSISAENGIAQALAWNIGVITSTLSREEAASTSGSAPTIACSTIERCE